ncbi:MAG TPA: hypothetical protein VGW38_24290 [Chloroflexota bacterium]|nr:hypothetical protein [Chloroflexota bacterium]
MILEGDEVLAEQTKRLRGQARQVRVRMLCLLKTGIAWSLPLCAPLVDYSERQLSRWWQWYREDGPGRLLAEKPRLGMPSCLLRSMPG